ncbi:DUF2157 domain-containing protein [Pedobacter frigoris]|uniref:DUF2157 domain-containing protein n=1 Tax=Pedobacter frigoris TaxID=2571272 RepID=UPI00292E97D4|nr:DUF2157 domain-containing protein [Pedobacter frigoris]
MNTQYSKRLLDEGLITPESYEKIRQKQANLLFSVHWEIKTVLYLGVMLLSTGLGILIYKNIDTIGHQVILLMIAAISAGCFFYCFKHKKPFSKAQVKSPGSLFDYILLLGCLSFLSFLGYLQAQYGVFGQNYGLATFIPMLVLFYVAYDYDHLGILSLAITNLALWLGVTVTPFYLLYKNDFDSERLIYTYFGIGLLLIAAAHFSEKFAVKRHFRFTYLHFGVHMAFISLLSGYFYKYEQPFSIGWLFTLFILAFYCYTDAMKHKSFYFILLIVLYSYIALSALVVRGLITLDNEGALYITFLYFIVSAIGMVLVLINLNKKLKAK